ncbi:MAG TPA: hypothetical protein PKG49_08910 [Nitrosomonas mobilis]|nr:hypothetical protein [Nitrosomonas mobilis]
MKFKLTLAHLESLLLRACDLFDERREALGYIQRNYPRETVIKQPDRAEAARVWNVPYAAIEEALANATYHCSS